MHRSLFFALFYLLLALPAQSAPLTLYTEEYPPFNYSEGEKITGVSTEVVKRVMELAGESYRIESYPWARSYVSAQNGAGNLIYSISRLESREKLFQWIGEIVPNTTSAYTLSSRSDVAAGNLKQLKRYSMVTTFRDAKEMYLLGKGFDKFRMTRLSGKDTSARSYLKLKEGIVDVWPMSDAVAFQIVRQQGDDPNTALRKLFTFEEISKKGYFLAASPETDPATVKRLRETLETFRQSEEYRAILKKWGL